MSTATTTIGINSVNVRDLHWENKTYKLKRSIRDLTKMIRRRQLEHANRSVLSLFVLLWSVFFFSRKCFAVAAQVRREMTEVLVYLTRGTARRKKFTDSDAVPSLQLTTDFPSVR